MLNVEKRYGYLCIGIITLFCVGFLFTWSIFSTAIASEYTDWGNAKLTATYTLYTLFFCLGGFFNSLVLKSRTMKTSYFIAAITMFLGFFIAANSNGIITLYLGYGVLCGFATGILLNITMATVTSWFPGRAGFISGLLLMGEGVGSFIIGKIFRIICTLEGCTWREAFLFFAVITFIILVVASILLDKNSCQNIVQNNSEVTIYLDITPQQMIRRISFQLFFVLVVLQTFAGLALLSQAQNLIYQIAPEISIGTATTIVGILSICNSIGVLLIGGIFDTLQYYKTILLTAAGFILGAIIILLAGMMGNLIVITIGFVIFGIFFGGGNALNTAVILNLYGNTHYAANYAVMNSIMLIASLGGVAAGVLIDLTNNYTALLSIITTFGVISFILGKFMKTP